MLFEEYYSSGFKSNPKKEGASFFGSVSSGNDDSLNNGKVFPNGFWNFNNEEKETSFDTTKAKSEASSSPFFGVLPEGDKAKGKDVQSWNIPFTSPAEISLDDLASAHLQNHKLPTRSTASAQPLFSDKAASKVASQSKIPAVEAEDDLERIDDVDVEVKKPCLDTIVIGVKMLSLQERCPSSFGHVLCHRVEPSRKNEVFCDVGLRCPPQIKPFNFTTPSPDDIVRNSQKLRIN